METSSNLLEELKEKSKQLYEWFTDNFNCTESIRIDFDGVHLEQRIAFQPNDYVLDREVKMLDVLENQSGFHPTQKGIAKWAAVNSGLLEIDEAHKDSKKFNEFWELFLKYLFRANQ